MKIYRLVPIALILCIFTFTNSASAYSAPSHTALTTQLQGLLLQLHALLGQSAPLTAATTVAPITPRTCQVNIYTRINGVEKYASTTMSGAITDQFAIGLSIGTSSQDLPFGVMVQSQTWGKSSTTATAEYFTPAAYASAKATLAAYVPDPHYKVLSIPLDNVNNPNSSTTFSSAAPYAEGFVTNDAIGTSILAGKVTVRANVLNCTAAVLPPPVQNPNKPNILFILTDDLDVKMMEKLPKLKALLADKGMTFENDYTSLSLCCPSRTATLCGEYAHNNGVFTNEANNDDGTNGAYTAFQKFGDDKKTMAVWLQNAGYRTALMGKYLNGYSVDAHVAYNSVPAGWSEWAVGFDGNTYSQYNYTLNVNGAPEPHYLSYCTKQAAGPLCPVRFDASPAALAERQQNFMINVLDKKAKDFMTRSAKDSTPFFLYLAPYTPHGPATPAPRYESLLTDTAWLAKNPLPRPVSFNETDVSDKPAWLKDNAGLLQPGGIAILQSTYRKRLISMYAVQDMVSDLIDTLEKNGQLDNTYIVFTSDNGFHLGEHRLTGGKLTEFDTDLHVPLIIRGPKVAAGSVSTQLTGNVDIAPTLTSLANVAVPASVDGRSFKETLLGGTSVPRNAFLIEHADPSSAASVQKIPSPNAETRDTVAPTDPISGGEFTGEYRGIRTSNYTYVHYKTGEEELYDNVNDPDQMNNVAAVAGATFMSVLRKWTTDLSACKGASCRTIEAENRLNGIKGALDGKACFFGGQQINNGSSYTFYTATTSTPSCDAVKQVRTCTDGKLSGSDTYKYTSCVSLERFTGINMNAHPENLDLALMDKAGAKWVRVIANFLPYYLGTRAARTRPDTSSWSAFLQSAASAPASHDYTDWQKFIAAHTSGKKGIINIEWDFEAYNLRIPAASSTAEIALFKYLDDEFLKRLLPYADIIVVGNEPFLNTLPEDIKKDSSNTVPIAEFYKRVANHINTYMVNEERIASTSPYARSKHKLYLGAFTHLYGPNMQKLPAVLDLLKFANTTDYIDGVDIHTHGYSVQDIEDSLIFVSKHVTKPITDTEYSYVYEQLNHLTETLSASDTHPFGKYGKLSFLDKYYNATATKDIDWEKSTTTRIIISKGQVKYSATTTVIDFMGLAAVDPVPLTEWNDFFRSRSWTIDHFLATTSKIFNKYNVNGVTFGFMQGGVSSIVDGAPWFMVPVYASGTVQHLPGTLSSLLNGAPQGNYQNLTDFQKINHVPVTP